MDAYELDKVGNWSQVKLDIIKEYANSYAQILAANKLYYIYIDGFAGGGKHLLRDTGEIISGSPQNALNIEPKFKEYHFIDLNPKKIESLKEIVKGHSNVYLYQEDCNEVLLTKVFPRIRYERFMRALCILDPYGIDLDWKVIQEAGKKGTIDIFLNFSIMDMNRNVLRKTLDRSEPKQIERFNRFWGDDSWRRIIFNEQDTLFNGKIEYKIGGNVDIVDAYRDRLRKIAGFKYIPKPVPMLNSKNNVVYYLLFASHKEVASKLAVYIFNKHQRIRLG